MVDGADVLKAIIESIDVCPSLDHIAETLSATREHIDEIVSALSEHQLLSSWFAPPDPIRVTLTPLAASQLGVALCESGGHRLRWVPRSVTERRTRTRRSAGRIDGPVDKVHSREPDPSTVAEANEAALLRLSKGRSKLDALPWPTVLLTGSDSLWSEVDSGIVGKTRKPVSRPIAKARLDFASAAACSACRGSELRANTLCLRCNRWGRDAALSAHLRAERSLGVG
jgi:hypothetical protein